MPDTLTILQDIVRDVFGDDDLTISRETGADDIEGWDSMMHINVIIAVEKRLGIRFAAAESAGLKEAGQNLGSFCDLVERKLAAKK